MLNWGSYCIQNNFSRGSITVPIWGNIIKNLPRKERRKSHWSIPFWPPSVMFPSGTRSEYSTGSPEGRPYSARTALCWCTETEGPWLDTCSPSCLSSPRWWCELSRGPRVLSDRCQGWLWWTWGWVRVSWHRRPPTSPKRDEENLVSAKFRRNEKDVYGPSQEGSYPPRE